MRTLIFILFILITSKGFCQQKDNPLEEGLIGKEAQLNMYHNFADLEKLNKDVLVRIYTTRVMAMMELLPFCALNAEKAKTLETLGIPNTKDNIKILSKYIKSKHKYEEQLQYTMSQTSVYAEKQDLIDMILLMERFLGEIKSQFN